MIALGVLPHPRIGARGAGHAVDCNWHRSAGVRRGRGPWPAVMTLCGITINIADVPRRFVHVDYVHCRYCHGAFGVPHVFRGVPFGLAVQHAP